MKLFSWFFYIKFVISVPAQNDARSALLSDIRDGPMLRPAMNNSENPPLSCARDDLLEQLRKGIELKSAKQIPSKPTQNNRACNDPLAAALFQTLSKIRIARQDSEDEDEFSGEWSD